MSDREKKSLPVVKKGAEPSAAEGSRSLSSWQKLADARRDLAGDEGQRAALKRDPSAFLAQYGINSQSFLKSPGGQVGLSTLERQLAFSGDVEREQLGVHRAASLVVGPVALAAAGVAVCAGAVAGNVAGAVNVAGAWNAAYKANVAWTENWVSGIGHAD